MSLRSSGNRHIANAFIPEDRRRALAANRTLPPRAHGAALFADISGFTQLTESLAQRLGPRRGAEILTRQLNLVYSALISAVEAWQGSVIGFSGDAITCWFDEQEAHGRDNDAAAFSQASVAAVNAAYAMQHAMAGVARMILPGGVEASLALRTTVITSTASRLQVGDPSIQLIDVLAGRALDELADADHAAHQSDVVVDLSTLAALGGRGSVKEWRTSPGGKRVAVLAQPDGFTELQRDAGAGLPLLDDRISRQWVLDPVYERLHSEAGRFLAELRPATALFLQFRGLDFDEDAHAGAALDAYVRWVQGVVHEHEGAVIQLTTGDKGSYLYAAFGALITHDDDAQRAVAAALSLRSPPPEFGSIRDIRIGLSQGLMRVGTYGSDSRLTYGVLGDATNLAARLMVQAEPQQICISANVAEEIGTHFEIAALGLRRFKGKAEPQQVFAVLRARTQAADYASNAASPLIGRDAELSLLQAILEDAGRTGAVVRLVGDAGAGKSHLTSHVASKAAEQGMQVVIAACQSTAQNSAYFAAEQFVRSLLSLPPVLDSGTAVDKHAQVRQLEGALEALSVRWMLRLPLLGDLLGLPIPDNPTTGAFDARMRQEALAALVIDIVRGASQERPLLLIIEDAHWLDEASRALVQALAHIVSSSSVILLLVHRPFGPEQEKTAGEWNEIPGQQTIYLTELDADSTAQLVRQRLAGDVEPLGLAFIHSLAQGNPFFTEELVDALCEGSLLRQEEGRWQLSSALVDALRRANCLERVGSRWQLVSNAPLAAIDIGVPSSINGLVLSRLDRLPEDNKLTLKVASVIGRVFELDLLAAAHPSKPNLEMLEPQFRLLQQRDFARVETQKPRPVYVFKHNITQEVVYQTLLESQRQDLHVSVAEAIETRLPDNVEQLAHHYGQGDTSVERVRAKAIHYIDAAGWRARKEHANETALTYFDRALQFELRWSWLKGRAEVLHILGRRMHEEATLLALEELGSEDPQERMEVAMLWAKLYAAIGDHRPAAEALNQALALALDRGDHHLEARCYAEQATIEWRQGDYAAAQNGYFAALRLAGGEQLDIESEAHYGLGIVYRQQSRFDEARKQFEQALVAAERLGDLQYEARALNALGSVANLERDYLGAAELFAHALEIRETIGDRAGIGASLMSLAQAYGYMGDYSRVESLLHQALEIQQAMRNRWEEMLIHNELGILYTTVGQYDTAFVHLEQAMERARLIESDIGAAYILCNLGQAQRDAGRVEEALKTLQRGLLLAQAQGDIHLEAIYLNDFALTSLRAGAYQEAVAKAQRSQQLFLELDQALSLTAVYGCLAEAYLSAGDHVAAETAALKALSLLDGCGGEGPDFPQRDYWFCARALAALGRHEMAHHAAEQAALLLRQRADRISDETMRGTYLTQVAVHAEIIASRPA